MVTWGKPTSANGVILRYVIHRTQDSGQTQTQVFTGLAFNYRDSSVLPFKDYEYRVAAANSVGMVTSDWTSVTTRSAPPEEVSTPRILSVAETSLVVAFKPPGKPNGLIVNYIVRVNNQSAGIVRVNNQSVMQFKRTIRNLEPYEDYSLRVFACTVAGCTPSQAISSKTDTGKPGKVEEPTFGEITANSIEVHWKPPAKLNGEIKRYKNLVHFYLTERKLYL